jgi:hypothetical protein
MTALGGAISCPLAARAQPAMPVMGSLAVSSRTPSRPSNVIEYRNRGYTMRSTIAFLTGMIAATISAIWRVRVCHSSCSVIIHRFRNTIFKRN